MKTPLLLLVPCAVLAACGRAEAPGSDAAGTAAPANSTVAPEQPSVPASPASTVVTLAGKSGSLVAGRLALSPVDDGVSIAGELTGLTKGAQHGFHIHEKGDCSAPDASSAGEHFNPENAPHGSPTGSKSARHLGDLPNVTADDMGNSSVVAVIKGATLRDGGPNDLIGKSVIVHEKRDDYATQPGGDTGGRIACGVIGEPVAVIGEAG